MAYTYTLPSPLTFGADTDNPTVFQKLWMLDWGVGPDSGQTYARTDVLLLQYMFYMMYYGPNAMTSHSPPQSTPIAMDGVFGPETERHIIAFQQLYAPNVLVDGRVDVPAPLFDGSQPITPNSHTVYTLPVMNLQFRGKNSTIFDDPSTDSNIPQELLVALQNVQANASSSS